MCLGQRQQYSFFLLFFFPFWHVSRSRPWHALLFTTNSLSSVSAERTFSTAGLCTMPCRRRAVCSAASRRGPAVRHARGHSGQSPQRRKRQPDTLRGCVSGHPPFWQRRFGPAPASRPRHAGKPTIHTKQQTCSRSPSPAEMTGPYENSTVARRLQKKGSALDETTGQNAVRGMVCAVRFALFLAVAGSAWGRRYRA